MSGRAPSARSCSAPMLVQVTARRSRRAFPRLPGLAGPDVLGVRRDAPRQAAHQGGVARHRRRRMQEVGVEPLDAGRQLGRQHQRLAQAAQPVGRGIAPQVGEEAGARRRIARQAPRLQPAGPHAARIVLQVFRQIDDAALHAIVHGMTMLVGRPAQRPDFERNAARLEAGDLLGDEGLGQARPALEHDRDTRVDWRRHEGPGDQVLARAGGTAGGAAGPGSLQISSSGAGPR